MNRIFYLATVCMIVFFSACQDSGSSDLSRYSVKEDKVVTFSGCGGFADRNVTDINLSHDNTYVAYDVVNSQKTLYLTQYNAPITCNAIETLGMSAGRLGSSVIISIAFDSLEECYCLRDVKMKVVLYDSPDTIYNIRIDGQHKGEHDPDINFTVDTDKNSTGIVSFPRSVEPWGL